jgi:hypothetical protein
VTCKLKPVGVGAAKASLNRATIVCCIRPETE